MPPYQDSCDSETKFNNEKIEIDLKNRDRNAIIFLLPFFCSLLPSPRASPEAKRTKDSEKDGTMDFIF